MYTPLNVKKKIQKKKKRKERNSFGKIGEPQIGGAHIFSLK